jgi:spore germination protein
MVIHVVQAGETISEIAERYGVSAERLILDNEVRNPDNLAVGKALVILFPRVTHTVLEGDTLSEIASMYGTSVIQLLRNNPFLSDREFIYQGEELVISYMDEKEGRLSTYGYTYPYINMDTLIKTLPFLTYLTIYSYFFNNEGEVSNLDDARVIELAREYRVAPVMMLSAEDFGQQDNESNILQNVLISRESQNQLIYNVINVLRAKGYYGVNFNVTYIYPQNRNNFVEFMTRFSNRVKSAGFEIVFNTMSLSSFELMTGTVYEGFDYTRLIQSIDGLFMMTYEWGNFIGIPTGIISFDDIRRYVCGLSDRFPPEMIYIGIPVLGYIWELPFVLGVSRGLAISGNSAVELSKTMNAEIHYDEISETAYFHFITDREYIVRFRDARSIYEYLKLVNEFGLNGISIWNIMQFNPQLWLLVNSLFEINSL